jgi:hypothetical protein
MSCTTTPAPQVTPEQFRLNFTAFTDQKLYPTPLVQMWLDEAYNSMDPNRFSTSLDLYAQLKAAHWIVLMSKANREAGRGGTPGQATGITSSKSVGPASVSFDTGNAVAKEGGADYWNQSIYGQQYWRKARLVGMGGVQFI